MLTEPGSAFAASMLRDLQRGGPTEADHIVGDMLRRAKALGLPATVLRACYAICRPIRRSGADRELAMKVFRIPAPDGIEIARLLRERVPEPGPFEVRVGAAQPA